MSVYRAVRLFCDGRTEPTEASPRGIACSREYIPPGWFKSFPAIRAEAAKDGWTYIRYPNRKLALSLDKDYCPDHKPVASPRDSSKED
jgi:hypothetical protein